MDRPIINYLSLCSGVGLLDEAFAAGCWHIGWRANPVALCEREAYAAACLLARMEESSMEPAPVYAGDLRDFDGRQFRGVVDAVIAGLPCQPYSCAGKQRGNVDERSHGEDGDGPIPHALRIIAAWFWTRAESISSGAEETASWRRALQRHLSNLCEQ